MEIPRRSIMVTDWPSLAACQSGDPDALFVQGAEQNVAKRVCRQCPVRYECLADALDNRVEFGVWGGMTERERRALLRSHPQVTSWRKLFEAAMKKEYQKRAEASRIAATATVVGAAAVETANAPVGTGDETEQAAIPMQRCAEDAEEPEMPSLLLEDQAVTVN